MGPNYLCPVEQGCSMLGGEGMQFPLGHRHDFQAMLQGTVNLVEAAKRQVIEPAELD